MMGGRVRGVSTALLALCFIASLSLYDGQALVRAQDCPSNYTLATASDAAAVVFIGSNSSIEGQSCCDKYALEVSCNLEVYCPEPSLYNSSYGTLFPYSICGGDNSENVQDEVVLLGFDGSCPVSCDDSISFLRLVSEQSGCESAEFERAKSAAVSS